MSEHEVPVWLECLCGCGLSTGDPKRLFVNGEHAVRAREQVESHGPINNAQRYWAEARGLIRCWPDLEAEAAQ